MATDIAARGIDVDEITHVVNYDVPYAAEDYVHRIGRTARAGRTGMAIMLVTKEEMRGVRSIERLIGFSLPEEGGELVPLSAGERGSEPSRRSAARRGGSGRRERGGAGRRGASRGSGSSGGGGGGGRSGGGRGGGGERGADRAREEVGVGAGLSEAGASDDGRNGGPGGPKKRRRRRSRSGATADQPREARTHRAHDRGPERRETSDRDRDGKKEKRSFVQNLLGKLGLGG
ncbi:MAG: C-terminal helicase domain-containing protein [Candidatus Eisenbacteria bacterium]